MKFFYSEIDPGTAWEPYQPRGLLFAGEMAGLLASPSDLCCARGVWFVGCARGVWFVGCARGVWFVSCARGVWFVGCARGMILSSYGTIKTQAQPGNRGAVVRRLCLRWFGSWAVPAARF